MHFYTVPSRLFLSSQFSCSLCFPSFIAYFSFHFLPNPIEYWKEVMQRILRFCLLLNNSLKTEQNWTKLIESETVGFENWKKNLVLTICSCGRVNWAVSWDVVIYSILMLLLKDLKDFQNHALYIFPTEFMFLFLTQPIAEKKVYKYLWDSFHLPIQ